MNLQLLTGLFVALIHVVYSQGIYEDCCLKYSKPRKPALLRNIRRFKIQEVNGSCNIRAVIFELRKKNVICGNPEEKWVKDKIRQLQRKIFQGSKKVHEGNIVNAARLLTQGVQSHQVHGARRNHTRLEHISGSMKFTSTQKPSLRLQG
ncbi:C-C motif chemokine 25 [Sarcophilus harrisii]|uniref:C-C motif chemokine 25 n=1 Tax=Sarcophilus harrisii TaxID=9305 RepID=UPI00062B3278|nr:C-C motif chemokine 25 [Sarcophilus harrisii]